MQSDVPTQQEEEWEQLYQGVVATLAEYGVDDPFGNGDYLIVDDNYGWRQNTVEVHKLRMLAPDIISALQVLLRGHPRWKIVVAVDVPGKEKTWPPMGLTIFENEIVDELQREFLPAEFQGLKYG